MERLKNIWNRLTRKKQTEAGGWGGSGLVEETILHESVNNVTKDPTTDKHRSVKVLTPVRRKKIRIRFLGKAKRVIAGILFIVNFFTVFLTFPQGLSVFFMFSSFIMLDYLWKTRAPKYDWEKSKKRIS